MPIKGGKLTAKERVVIDAYAETGSQGYAAMKAKITQGGASHALQRPQVQAEIARKQQEMLFNEILPLAVKVHKQILADDRTPAGARVQAVKLAYDRTLGSQDGNQAKEPHEMSAEEISKAIEHLEREASSRAKVINQDPVNSEPDGGVFE